MRFVSATIADVYSRLILRFVETTTLSEFIVVGSKLIGRDRRPPTLPGDGHVLIEGFLHKLDRCRELDRLEREAPIENPPL